MSLKLLILVLATFQPRAAKYAKPILHYSKVYKFDPLLVAAVIQKESKFRKICFRGSHGLMQIQLPGRSCEKTKAEAKRRGLYGSRTNIKAGVHLMWIWRRWWKRTHSHRDFHWLLLFNQGYGKCPKDRRIPCTKINRIPVTTGKAGGYANRVLDIYRKLKEIENAKTRPRGSGV